MHVHTTQHRSLDTLKYPEPHSNSQAGEASAHVAIDNGVASGFQGDLSFQNGAGEKPVPDAESSKVGFISVWTACPYEPHDP